MSSTRLSKHSDYFVSTRNHAHSRANRTPAYPPLTRSEVHTTTTFQQQQPQCPNDSHPKSQSNWTRQRTTPSPWRNWPNATVQAPPSSRCPVCVFLPNIPTNKYCPSPPGSDSSRPTLVAIKGTVFDVSRNNAYGATGQYRGESLVRPGLSIARGLRMRGLT